MKEKSLNQKMKSLFCMLLATVVLVACDTGKEDETPKSITVPNQQQLSQTVYADDNTGKSGVSFTTNGAWTTDIKESVTPKTTRAAADWISISPSGGDKAGDYTIQISLLTNYTGEKRSATISLVCGSERVAIVVTQEAVTAAGEQPKPDLEPSGEGVLKNETTGKSVDLTGFTHEIATANSVRVQFLVKGSDSYLVDFINPLQDGKLKPHTYKVKMFNLLPRPEMFDGECEWFKSGAMGGSGYGSSGTIKVELNNDIYTFTFNFHTDEGDQGNYNLTGSFTGVPEYLNKEVKVASITLNETNKTLEMGENCSLTATVLPENATDKRYTWSSSNPAVATVSEEGFVKSVTAGTATITATTNEGGKTATCAVTVKTAVSVTGITVDPSEVTLVEGDNLQLYDKITILPEKATNKKYTWKSSDENVAAYDGKTMIAISAGNATITFTTEDGAKTATLKVTVTERESLGSGSIKTTDTSGKVVSQHAVYNVNRTIVAKDEVCLDFRNKYNDRVSELTFFNLVENGNLKPGTYTILDHFNNITGTSRYGYVKSPMWSRPASTGGDYMYYYKSGTVTVAKSGDYYTITFNNVKTNSTLDFESESVACSYSGKFIHTNEYVAASSVTLDKTALTLTVGGGYLLEATVNPSNAFNKKVTWNSSNPNVASVSDNGYVYTSGVGTATITVITEDGAKTATCQVTVNALPSTGSGTFLNNQSQSLVIDRAGQWVNEKEPKEIEIRFSKPNSAYGALTLTLVRATGDTGTLKAGTYTSIRNLMADGLGVKQSYNNTGSVIVAFSGENYTVTLDVTSSDGIKITGTYTGKIPV